MKRPRLSFTRAVVVGCLSFVFAACTHQSPSTPPSNTVVDSGPRMTPEQGQTLLEENAKAERESWKNKTFEEFKAQTYKEPFEDGKFIVNGDTPIMDEKHLKEFFDRIQGRAGLSINTVNGQDTAWNSVEKRQLTYCVSTAFGQNYDAMVSDIKAAAKTWESVAAVDYIHVAGEDASCNASNPNVLFDVRPVNVNGQYLARAFFPDEPRSARNVLVDNTSFQLDPTGKLSLQGILRHELGHTLGFRHEHTRPDSGTCFEDNNWRPLTSYDAFSVMHYPQCNGQGDWALTLTAIDKSGAACVYDPAPGFTIDTSICQGAEPTPGPVACGPKTETFADQQVAKNAWNSYGPFPVTPGTLVEIAMHGEQNPGDPDLYVRFDQDPQTNAYDCRPYLSGAEETCSLDVPANVTATHVRVRGYSLGNYSLTVTHTPGTH